MYKWVVEHNSEVEYFLEKVMFEDLHDDWNEVCDVVGQPLVILLSDVAMTRRRRAYFTNIELPESFGPGTLKRCATDLSQLTETSS